jgi:hypothetical protein
MKGAIQTFEDLEKWFMQIGNTKWTIFRGDPVKRNYVYQQSDAEMQIEESWELLREMLEMNAVNGHYFNILVDNGSSRGFRVYFSMPQQTGRSTSSSGIGSIPGVGSTQDYINGQIEQKMRIYDLQRQVEDLQAAEEAKLNWTDRIIDAVVNHPNFDPNVLVQIGSSFIGALMPKAPAGASVGISGFEKQAAQQAPTQAEYDAQRIASALDQIQSALPDVEIHDFMDALAVMVTNNPAMARQLFQQNKPGDE